MRLRTPSQTVGPYYAIGLCREPENELVEPGSPGALQLVGRVLDGDDAPVLDALVEVFAGGERWGRSGTDGEGRFSFVVSKPSAVDGGAPHLDAFVFARGLLAHQLLRIYFPDEEANASDPVLASLPPGERATLIAERADGGLRFDIRLQGERQTVFFAH
jgi:protocatechuate 3,4-dioxygenase alpha subunit